MVIPYVQKCTYQDGIVTLLLNVKGNKKEERVYTKQALEEVVANLRKYFPDYATALEEVLVKWPMQPSSNGQIDQATA